MTNETPNVKLTVTITLPDGKTLTVEAVAKPCDIEFELKTIAERGVRFAQEAYPFAVY